MRATRILLTAIGVLAALVVAAAGAAQASICTIGPDCVKIIIQPNHVCYVPDPCLVGIDVTDIRTGQPRPLPADLFLLYDVRPVDGPARGFIPVESAMLTIHAGQTGGAVPIQLRPVVPLEERARVTIHNAAFGLIGNGTSEVTIRNG